MGGTWRCSDGHGGSWDSLLMDRAGAGGVLAEKESG